MTTLAGLPTLEDLLFGTSTRRTGRRFLEPPDPFGPAPLGGDAEDESPFPDALQERSQPWAFSDQPSHPAAGTAPFGGSAFRRSDVSPFGDERRVQHPRFRQLVDAGPQAVEGELRDFLRQAPPEDVAANPRAWWQTALEYVDLPRNAVANLVAKVGGVEPTSKEEFAGLRKIYGSDLLRAMGWKPDSTIGKVGHFLAGLTIDFLMDPITWLSGALGLARGTVKTAAGGAAELARDISKARMAGKGITLAERLAEGGEVLRPALHVRPQATERLLEATRATEGFLPEIAEAPGSLNAVERAAATLGPEDLYAGRWGLGASTAMARRVPLGHILTGPLTIGATAAGKLVEGAGSIAENLLGKIPGVGEAAGALVGRPLQFAGRGLVTGSDVVGRVADKVGIPLSFIPEATVFKPFREMKTVGPALDWLEETLGKVAEQPGVAEVLGGARKIGAGLAEVGHKIGILPPTPLQNLFNRYLEQAQKGVRADEKEFREEFRPLLTAAARASGIAAEDLEPLYSVFVENLPIIQRAAGDPTALRAALANQEAVVASHLGEKYSQTKIAQVLKPLQAVIDSLLERPADQIAKGSAGSPAAVSSSGERAQDSITSRNVPPPGTQALPDQVSTRPPPPASSTTRRILPRPARNSSREGSVTTETTDLSGVGGIDPSSNLIIHQSISDVKALQAGAAAQARPLADMLDIAVEGLPAHVQGVRVKQPARIQEKLAAGKAPENLSDYLGGRIVVDDHKAIDEIIGRFREAERIAPQGVQDQLSQPNQWGYRAKHIQVLLDNGMTAEVQLVPREVAEVQRVVHPIYERLRSFDAAGATPAELAQYVANKATMRKSFDDAWARFTARTGYGRAAVAGMPESVIDLKLPGTSYGDYSLSYKHGISGSVDEARNYARQTLTASRIREVGRQLGLSPSLPAGRLDSPEGINAHTWYHGSAAGGLTPQTVDPFAGSHESLLGQGFYLTDSPEIAAGYAKARSSRRGRPTVYAARVQVDRVLDAEAALRPEVATAIEGAVTAEFRPTVQQAAQTREATPESVIQALRRKVEETSRAEDVPSSEYAELFQDIAVGLRRAGFDAITHTGGQRTGRPPHRVLILLDPADQYSQVGRAGQLKSLVPSEGRPTASPVVFVPMPSTSGADNRVPQALAERLAGELGGTVAPDLLSAGTFRSRRAKGLLPALANPRDIKAAEQADLPAGARLVLVDDVMKSGGTMRDAASALREGGYEVAGAVVGKTRRTSQLTANPLLLDELRRRGGAGLEPLLASIGRQEAAELTAVEAKTLLEELRKPGATPEAVRRKLEALREVPQPAGQAPAATRRGLSREGIEEQLRRTHDDLVAQGLLDDVLARNAGTAADIETPHAAGYTFTQAMAGEARDLQEALRSRGYKRLVGRVRVRGPKERAVAGQTGDDAYNALRDAGEADPLERMAESIIGHEELGTKAGVIRRVLDYFEANPEIATPWQKDLIRRYHALTADDPAVRKAARGKAGELVDPEALQIGDRVSLAGESHTVAQKDEQGILLKDGVEVALQPGEPVVVDRGSHRPDPVRDLVSEAVTDLRGRNLKPSVDTVLGFIKDRMAQGGNRDAGLKELFGLERLKGSTAAMKAAVERALWSVGEGSRGIGWERLFKRLENVEQGVTGRGQTVGHLAKIESVSHPQGALIQDVVNPVAGGPNQELTEDGRNALRAMRAYLAAGQTPEKLAHVARLTEDLDRLGARINAAKRTGRPRPPADWQQFTLKKEVLRRLGQTIEDDPAWWAARVEQRRAETLQPETPQGAAGAGAALPIPKAQDLFAEPVARVVDYMFKLERRTRAEEAAAGVATADITRTTERGMGYFPRILGNAKTVVGKLQRRWGFSWEREWQQAERAREQPISGTSRQLSTLENVKLILRAENKSRVQRGLPVIAEPGSEKLEDLGRQIATILDAHPELTAGHRHQLMRTFARELLTHEINDLAEYTGIAFQTDPVAVWLKRRYASHFATAGADFLKAAIADAAEHGWAVPIKGKGATPEGFSRITDARFGNLARGWAFKEDLVKEFKRFSGTMDRPNIVLRALDWATSQWRTTVLGVFPYTMTNLLSGVFQANQHGAFSHQDWSAARRFMEDYHAGRNLELAMSRYLPGLPAEVGKRTVEQFYEDLSVEYGALGKGLHGVDMEKAVGEGYRTEWAAGDAFRSAYDEYRQGLKDRAAAGGSKAWRFARGVAGTAAMPVRGYFRWFRAVNVAVEDWMKAGFILSRLRQGDDMALAVQKGRMALNQSADLTQFERDTFRRLLPFWGWMKGNAVLQFTMALARPQITALVPKIRGDLESSFVGEEQVPPSLRPRHVAEELGVQLTGGAKPDFYNLTRLFPVKELGTTPLAGGNAVSATLEALLSGLNPFLKGGIESAVNRDFYWDRPINEYPEQTRKWLGLELSPQAKRVASMVRPLNVFEQLSWRGTPTTAGDTAFLAAQTLGARTFPVDVERQIFDADRTLRDQLSAIMRDYARARTEAERDGRDWRTDPAVQRLAEIYAGVVAQRDRLPLKFLRETHAAQRRQSRQQRTELKQFALTGS